MSSSPGRAHQLLSDAFGRVRDGLPTVLDGLGETELAWRPDPEANSAGWLVWHLLRVQDDHLAGVGRVEQAWTAQGFYERSGLPFPAEAHGFGHSTAEVAQVRLGPDFLREYAAAVAQLTERVLSGLSDTDLDEIVDESFDPPVTAAVRLVSVVGETAAHLGQVEYLRGLIDRGAAQPDGA